MSREQTSGSNEKQSFSRIHSIEARSGQILVRTKQDAGSFNPLHETVMSVREAAERAASLNKMASKFRPADRQTVDELIAEIIARCEEAQQQIILLSSPASSRIHMPGVNGQLINNIGVCIESVPPPDEAASTVRPASMNPDSSG